MVIKDGVIESSTLLAQTAMINQASKADGAKRWRGHGEQAAEQQRSMSHRTSSSMEFIN